MTVIWSELVLSFTHDGINGTNSGDQMIIPAIRLKEKKPNRSCSSHEITKEGRNQLHVQHTNGFLLSEFIPWISQAILLTICSIILTMLVWRIRSLDQLISSPY